MNKPQMTQQKLDDLIKKAGIDRKKYPVVMVGIRGYFLDSMGLVGKNDRGIYDDALFLYSPSCFLSVNGNTDPSRLRKGRGTGASKGMAKLKAGTWLYQTGNHNGSAATRGPAFRQADKVTVTRDGTDSDYEDSGMFAINIHRGGNNGTSSLGCQTVLPAQWESFRSTAYSELKKYKQKVFPYLLLENDGELT